MYVLKNFDEVLFPLMRLNKSNELICESMRQHRLKKKQLWLERKAQQQQQQVNAQQEAIEADPK
jgi:hypothetical protein